MAKAQGKLEAASCVLRFETHLTKESINCCTPSSATLDAGTDFRIQNHVDSRIIRSVNAGGRRRANALGLDVQVYMITFEDT
jgi:hypothetical protein